MATSNHVLEEPEAEAVKEDSATLSKSGSALKLRYTYSDGTFRDSFAASILGTSNATLVLKGFFPSHSSHLFLCSPTEGVARIYSFFSFYLLNTQVHHFNVSGFNSFSLTPIPEREIKLFE